MANQYPTPVSIAGSYEEVETSAKRARTAESTRQSTVNTGNDEITRLLAESTQSRSDSPGYVDKLHDSQTKPSPSDFVDAERDLSVWGYMLSNTSTNLSFLLSKESRCGKGKKKEERSYEDGHTDRGIILKDYNGDNIASSGYLIGRNTECDVVINDSALSERHCVIFKINSITSKHSGDAPPVLRQCVYLQDISGAGTFVNDELIKQNEVRQLQNQDHVSLTKGGPVWIYRSPHMTEPLSFERRFKIGRTIGRGHFAEVYQVTEDATGQKFAAKVVKKKLVTNGDSFLQEIGLLMSCTHPLITCIRDVFETDTEIYLILELAAGGELFDRIIQKGHFSELETRDIFRQLFSALSYLHSRGIVHRDIKPENILLTSADHLEIRLADFGLAKIIGNKSATSTLAGTPSYIPPEMLTSPSSGRTISFSNKVDSWSAGVVLYICLCGFPPFSQELAPPPLKTQIREGIYQFQRPYWDAVSDKAIDLVQRLLTVDPAKRLSIDEALDHPFMLSDPPNDIQVDEMMPTDTPARKGVKRQRTMLSQLGRPEVMR